MEGEGPQKIYIEKKKILIIQIQLSHTLILLDPLYDVDYHFERC